MCRRDPGRPWPGGPRARPRGTRSPRGGALARAWSTACGHASMKQRNYIQGYTLQLRVPSESRRLAWVLREHDVQQLPQQAVVSHGEGGSLADRPQQALSPVAGPSRHPAKTGLPQGLQACCPQGLPKALTARWRSAGCRTDATGMRGVARARHRRRRVSCGTSRSTPGV